MFKNIDKNNDIFKSDAYRKDVVPFQLLELIKENPILLVSDEKSFIIGASHPDMPVWVWTSDEKLKIAKKQLFFFKYTIYNLMQKQLRQYPRGQRWSSFQLPRPAAHLPL